MVENMEVELTVHEAELYDRQIRLWGLESQKRIRSAKILICGMNGLGAEVAKNIILSGVKSVTLCDHKNVTELDFCSQFMAPQTSVGTNRAEASLMRAQALNPMVAIVVDKEDVNKKPDEFFLNFDIVVVTEAPTKTLIRIDNACRMKGVKFFAGDLWGMHGYTFTDLQEHEFVEDVVKHKVISKPFEKIKTEPVTSTVKRVLQYPPYQDVHSFDYKTPAFLKKLKRNGPSYVVMKILQEFRDREGRDPCPKQRDADLSKILEIRNEIAEGLAPDNVFTHVFAQISPVAAVVGGELSQEIIKAVSQKESPHHNLFLFDPNTCCGYIESIETIEN